MFDSLKLSDLPERHHGILRYSSSTRPKIWLVEESGVRAVVKDFSANGFLYRNIAGRFLVWREAKALKKLTNINGTPALYRVVDGLALVMEEIPGKSLENLERETRLPPTFFDALNAIIDRFHKKGLAHCDLKRASNFLLGPDGLPYIIDWAASISKREFRFFPMNLIYRRFLLDDYMAIIKLKLRHIPEAVTIEERKLYNHRSGVEKLIRSIRDRIREILQRVA